MGSVSSAFTAAAIGATVGGLAGKYLLGTDPSTTAAIAGGLAALGDIALYRLRSRPFQYEPDLPEALKNPLD